MIGLRLYNIKYMNNFKKIVYLIRSILYLPLRLILLIGNFYSYILKIIDRRNHDTFWSEIMQKSIDKNISEKINIAPDKDIRFYCPSKISSFRVKTFFTKEPETLNWINTNGAENKVLYDLGANMGIYTIYYAKKFKSDVFAFEPSFKNLDLLMKNIKLNSLEENVFVIPNPISEKSLISNFFQLRSTPGGSVSTFNDKETKNMLLNNNKEENDSYQYKTLGFSIDNLIETNLIKPPDLIKIDVDGNELDIIKGFKKTIKRVEKLTMLIETNTSTSKNNLINELNDCGLKKINEVSVNSIWEK